jgi:hypothetical protein
VARNDKRDVDLIADALSVGRLWYGEPNAATNAVGHAKFRSRLCNAVIRVYDEAGNVIETHEHAGGFDVMLTYAWGPSASTSIGTPSHFAASLRS